VSNPLNPSY
jgi:hypothetical protein